MKNFLNNSDDNYGDFRYDQYKLIESEKPKKASFYFWKELERKSLSVSTKILNLLVWFMIIVILFLIILLGTGCKTTQKLEESYYKLNKPFVDDTMHLTSSDLSKMQFYTSDSFSLIFVRYTKNYRPMIVNGEITSNTRYPKKVFFERSNKGIFVKKEGKNLILSFDTISYLPIKFVSEDEGYGFGDDEVEIENAIYKTTNQKVVVLVKYHSPSVQRSATGNYYEGNKGTNSNTPAQDVNAPSQTGGVKPPGIKN